MFKNVLMIFALLFSISSFAEGDDFADEFAEEAGADLKDLLNISGFVDFEQGARISGAGPAYSGADSRDYVLANRRLRLKSEKSFDKGAVYFKVDFNHDSIVDKFSFDIREARFQYSIGKNTDLSVGRQVSTWGVGDLVFINDLFPKNWVSHFSGRDFDMIKDPSDTVRLTHYKGSWTFDLVVTPEFTADTTPTGCKYEVFDPNSGTVVLNSQACQGTSVVQRNSKSFSETELALSIKKKSGNHEFALYGYKGFYKSPMGLQAGTLPSGGPGVLPYHPELEVYGASYEGQIGPGILSFETGYYNSKEDSAGDAFFIENSAVKYLVGYRMDLSKNFSFGTQWYEETMLNYSAYEQSFLTANPTNYAYRLDKVRDTFTLRLGFKAMQETLFINIFSYLRPQDKDSFHKLEIVKRVSDQLQVSTGANIFTGSENYQDRSFGMLKDADNVFVHFKYIF